MKSPIRLHIANIDLCEITTETIVNVIDTLMENLDDVSKYKVAVDLTTEIDNLSQTCYDEASPAAQVVIESLEEHDWDYDALISYTEYIDMMNKFLNDKEVDATKEETLRSLVEDDAHDVADEFGFNKPNHNKPELIGGVQGQLHFPNNYASELALVKGEVNEQRTSTTSSQADEKKKARAQFLANVKAQQNTSQSK